MMFKEFQINYKTFKYHASHEYFIENFCKVFSDN